ncbi:unnamed protein product, partial [Sphacelaria rigidula]
SVNAASVTAGDINVPIEGSSGKLAAAVTAGVGQSRGRRRDRIQRMMTQAQTEQPQPGVAGHLTQQRTDTLSYSIAGKARQLGAAVISAVAFEHWLRGLETARTGARKTAAGMRSLAALSSKGKAVARPSLSTTRSRRNVSTGCDRFKSQEHPRVVIKDLDGLEADRVQALPPELMRKCNLHHDAPPGICPFTPREQWAREVLKQKKKANVQSFGGDGWKGKP